MGGEIDATDRQIDALVYQLYGMTDDEIAVVEEATKMTFELTQHAAEVVRHRAIKPDWIEQTLDAPSRVEPDRRDPDLVHHLRKIDEFGDRVLRVVFYLAAVPIRVVTVYFDRTVKDLS